MLARCAGGQCLRKARPYEGDNTGQENTLVSHLLPFTPVLLPGCVCDLFGFEAGSCLPLFLLSVEGTMRPSA